MEEPSRFESHLLVSDVCQLVVSREHPFAQMPGVHIRELRGETILTFSETATLHDTFIQMCGEQGFAPRIAYKSLMPGFSFKMVAMQQCIALLPLPLILHGMCDKLVTVPLEPRIEWDIAIIRRRQGYHSFAAAQLFDHIRAHFAERKPLMEKAGRRETGRPLGGY